MDMSLMELWKQMGPLAKGVVILMILMSVYSLWVMIERLVDPPDELALVIRLLALRARIVVARPLVDLRLELAERPPPVELGVALALDPGAVPFHEAFDSKCRCPRWNDYFHTTGVEHTHSETTCAITFANDPSLGSVLVGPQRQLRRNHA